MIWSVGKEDKLGPIAQIYLPDGSVEVVEGYNHDAQLAVITATHLTSTDLDKLLNAVQRGHEKGLVAAVIGEGSTDSAVAKAIGAIDAVFIVPSARVATVARRLVQAITSLCEPSPFLCCDWGDMHSLVANTEAVQGRIGYGQAQGPHAAKEAFTVALTQIGDIQHDCVIALVTGSVNLKIKQLTDVIDQLRLHVKNGQCLVNAVQDESTADGTVTVDIVAFGPSKTLPNSNTRPVKIFRDFGPLDLPAFLR